MNKRKKLPIGIESFEEMRKEDFYYVDKTRWIEQLLAQWGKVNLFTRPRCVWKIFKYEYASDISLRSEQIHHFLKDLYISKE